MPRSATDPMLAEQSIRKLAAVSDAEQSRDIRAAVGAVVGAWDAWRASPVWKRDLVADRLDSIVERARQALAELPADAGLDAVVDVAGQLVGPSWPDRPAPAARVSASVEQLRYVAQKRPQLVRDARRMAATGTAES